MAYRDPPRDTRFKPGEIANPEGRNQYTYRRDFELAIDELLKGVYEFRREVVEDKEGDAAHCLLCAFSHCDVYVGHGLYAHRDCIDQIESLTRGQVIALVTVQKAILGDEKMLPVVLERLWPKTTKIELPPRDPRSHHFIPTEDEQKKLRHEIEGNGFDHEETLQ